MDLYEIRRKNLHKLIAQYDGPTALAKRLGHKGTSYISQLSKGRRPVTEKTARDIEKQLKLPKLWFDGEISETVLLEAIRRVVASDDVQRAIVRKIVQEYTALSAVNETDPLSKPEQS